MRITLKQLHTYLGLLSLSILLVWGIVGMYEMLASTDPPQLTRQWSLNFKPAPNSSDRQVADAVYALVQPSLAYPVPDFALRRQPGGLLRLDFYSMNGIVRVDVHEATGRLEIEERRNNFARFLNNLHGVTFAGNSPHWQLQLWTLYTEFSIWALLAMSLSGTWMWLNSRPGYGPAIASTIAGLASFALLYFWVR